jgi:hypothetical protein
MKKNLKRLELSTTSLEIEMMIRMKTVTSEEEAGASKTVEEEEAVEEEEVLEEEALETEIILMEEGVEDVEEEEEILEVETLVTEKADSIIEEEAILTAGKVGLGTTAILDSNHLNSTPLILKEVLVNKTLHKANLVNKLIYSLNMVKIILNSRLHQ